VEWRGGEVRDTPSRSNRSIIPSAGLQSLHRTTAVTVRPNRKLVLKRWWSLQRKYIYIYIYTLLPHKIARETIDRHGDNVDSYIRLDPGY